MNIGFDVDGTLTKEKFEDFHKQCNSHNKSVDDFLYKMLEFTPTMYLDILKNQFIKGNNIFVITFRWEQWKNVSLKWFKLNGVEIDKINFYFSPPEYQTNDVETYKKNVLKYKSDIINQNNIEIYYEDSDFIVNELSILCPKTNIIKAVP